MSKKEASHRNTPTPTSGYYTKKPKPLTKEQKQEQVQQLAFQHSCGSLDTCQTFVQELINVVGEQI